MQENLKSAGGTMIPEKQERLQAQELYLPYGTDTDRGADKKHWKTVRQQMLEHVSPQITLFLSNKNGTQTGKPERKSCVGASSPKKQAREI